MSFADAMAADMDAVFLNAEEFGCTGVYTTRAGVAKSIECVMELGTDEERDGADGRTRVRRATLHISCGSSGIAAPEAGDSFVPSGGDEWAVDSVLMADGVGATLSLVRSEPRRRTGQGRVIERS
ncbi:MAG TPA: hypothetical protein PLE19_12705 [Planctomycetota bacterium]|nr:hypothetical protein [Planctomycetota bacterium]HRT95525.1 hypothetical protein [Planctomycetota bacterium]